MYNDPNDSRSSAAKWIIFCVSGLVIAPLLLQDCGEQALRRLHMDFPEGIATPTPALHPYNAAGSWTPDWKTVRYVEQLGASRHEGETYVPHLEMYEDGTFQIVGLPQPLQSRARKQKRVTETSEPPLGSIHGTWNAYDDQGKLKITVDAGQRQRVEAELVDANRLHVELSDSSFDQPLVFVRVK